MRKALITGITGQDGSYLAELLLRKGYDVHGIVRRSSSFSTQRIEHVYLDDNVPGTGLRLHYGDLNDASSLQRVLAQVEPDEVYNLGAQSHVRISFDIPEYTVEVTGVGTLRLLEAIRNLGLTPRFYQASSSEMFGKVVETPQSERTPFHPRSPVRVRQGLRPSRGRELPRELRLARVVRHPVQSRESAARREFRDAQDHAGPGADQTRPAVEAVPWQPRCATRLGVCRRLRRGDVADAAGGSARRLRDRDRCDPFGAATSSTRAPGCWISTGSGTWTSIPGTTGRRKSTSSRATRAARGAS